MQKLDAICNFANSHNPKIPCAWYEKTFLTKYSQVDEKAEEFLIHIGRFKFFKPQVLCVKRWLSGWFNFEIYTKAMPNYQFVAKETMKNIVALSWKFKVKISEYPFLKEKAVKKKVILSAFFLFFFQKGLFRLL